MIWKSVKISNANSKDRMKKSKVKIIGAGLAGCEAAWQLAKRGIDVELWEMRPGKTTPAHTTDLFSELVCSNSLKSNAVTNACGLLKEEMRRLDSIIMEAADKSSIPAGAALAVDRNLFAEYVTDKISSCTAWKNAADSCHLSYTGILAPEDRKSSVRSLWQ